MPLQLFPSAVLSWLSKCRVKLKFLKFLLQIFHLRDICWERSQFLSKSFLGFLAFNLLPYSLFGAEIISSLLFSHDRKDYTWFFSGCYAALLLIVVVFFLIYGVEVFFKVRGGFVYDYGNVPTVRQTVNASQLHQSRFGLLIQAIMMILVVGFLASETLGDFWKTKVPVQSRNWYDILFRLLEVGVALWFPCCLWNSMAPEQLWILNPRKLLTRQIDPSVPSTSSAGAAGPLNEEGDSFIATKKDCWICYDTDKNELLIQPCKCTGDVSCVHQECLRRWLWEKVKETDGDTEKQLNCQVCGSPYEIEKTNRVYWDRGFTIQHWARTFIYISLMCITGVIMWVIITLYTQPIIRVLTVGFGVIIGYVFFKLLGETTVNAYQRAKVSSINIVPTVSTSETEHLHTISQNVQPVH
ncbi:uncharacterized protein LOC134828519 [Culicoides brevitarsis]|uniref:uncharacterized protein LOC134828519 n=1 Tax=Culicoides brevitarsis TaxID=469753 RepID=UPI00307BF406